MNTENIAHYFYGSAPAEDELMNAVFSGENTAVSYTHLTLPTIYSV